MKIGILTGGGDSSAINDGIRAIVIDVRNRGGEVVGIRCGWKGLIEGDIIPLDICHVEEIANTGGTLICTSRTNPFKVEGALDKIRKNIKKIGLEGLIAFGGNDTLSVASRLAKEGLKVIGIPQTIDNDIPGTEYCVGFLSAIRNIVTSINMVTSTNKSHQIEMIVEVMGRDSGWLAVYSALAVGADMVVVPEFEVELDNICNLIKTNRARGKMHSLIIVSEAIKVSGAKGLYDEVDNFGNIKLGGIAFALADEVAYIIKLYFKFGDNDHIRPDR
ncbi:MAG: ATP-dependent 6-phosphofructokinase [Actinobacteria bacterium]|nr:ATP-dependent 6-phosphofructokinase [Actinomycetota bacterium]